MASLRFTNVPQPVVPNQRNEEVIFVLLRKHFVDYLPFALILSALVVIPLGAIIIGWVPLLDFISTSGTIGRDVLILSFLVYFLILCGIFITSWITYYYYLFVVSNERIVEIHQRGFFNREFDELDFEQIEDIASVTKGFLNTFFNVGNITIQTAGNIENFEINRVLRPQLAVEIIHSLTHQAKRGVPLADRFPDIETIGIINGQYVTRTGKKPAIMNINKNLRENVKGYKNEFSVAKTLREKLDRWWWRHNDQMVGTFGPVVQEENKTEEIKKEPVVGLAQPSINDNREQQIHDISEIVQTEDQKRGRTRLSKGETVGDEKITNIEEIKEAPKDSKLDDIEEEK